MKGKVTVKGLIILTGLFLLPSSGICTEPCQADFDCDGNVYPSDLTIMIEEYGREDCLTNPPCEADINGDGNVYPNDLTIMIEEYGREDCPLCVDIDCDNYDTCDSGNPNDTDGEPADCDDGDPDIYPGNIEVCDSEDNNWGDPGRRNMPLTCGETIQFTVCTGCLEDPCYVWSIDPPSTIGSTIDPDTGLYTAGTDCDYLDYPVEEIIVVTDPCNGDISDSVTVTVGQVILDILDINAHPDDSIVQVMVSLKNPDHKVKGIQTDMSDDGNDLACTGCAPDPDRAPQFTCSANELGDGKCRVLMTTTNPSVLISEGEGPVLTIDYSFDGIASADGCADLTLENISVSDKFGDPLCTCTDDGEICCIACGDLYPRECLPDNPVCGNGVVDIFDKLEVIDIVLGIIDPSDCQRIRADVPTGTLPYCNPPDGEINNFDVLVISDMAEGKPNCCDYYYFGMIY